MRNVRDYGAVGDGITRDTEAIQRAVDAGGMVRFPPGVYLSGSIYLRSFGGLHLEPGAILKASPDKADFNAPDFCPQNSWSVLEQATGKHLVIAVEQEDITLEGGGRVEGNFQAHMCLDKPMTEFMPGVYESPPEGRLGQMLYFCESRKIRIRDLELADSSYWHCFLHGCEDAILTGLRIYGHPRVNTNDGLDIDCCRNVTVSDCIIDVSDDAIAIRGNDRTLKTKRPCENIVVSNCVLSAGYACAIRVGVGGGVIRNCLFNNIVVPHAGIGLRLQARYSLQSEGTAISGIDFRNLRMQCAKSPVAICLDGPQILQRDDVPKCHKTISDISFADITATGQRTCFITGNRHGVIRDIRFRGVTFNYEGCGTFPEIHPETGWFGNASTDAIFDMADVESVRFRDTAWNIVNDDPGWKHAVRAERCPDISFAGCKADRPISLDGKVLSETALRGTSQ